MTPIWRKQAEDIYAVRLSDPDAMLHHNEPVLRNGQIIGFVTSGAFSAAQNAAVGLCLVTPPEDNGGLEGLEDGDFAVMVEGRNVAAELRRKPFYG